LPFAAAPRGLAALAAFVGFADRAGFVGFADRAGFVDRAGAGFVAARARVAVAMGWTTPAPGRWRTATA
jgi:hypothetical protein